MKLTLHPIEKEMLVPSIFLDYVELIAQDYGDWLQDALTYVDREAKILEAQRAMRNRIQWCLADEGFIAEVGDSVVNLREELDDDDDKERRTPPGTRGRVVSIPSTDVINVNFDNGAFIILTRSELYDPNQYTWTPKED